MFNEFDLLSDNPNLFHLLSHYARLGETDSERWQDRIMELDGVQTHELTKLHGNLLAHGWIAQNTGVTPILRLGEVPCCYRITPAGKRALKKAEQSEEEIETDPTSFQAIYGLRSPHKRIPFSFILKIFCMPWPVVGPFVVLLYEGKAAFTGRNLTHRTIYLFHRSYWRFLI